MTIAFWCVLFAALLPYLAIVIAKRPGARYRNDSPRDWAQGLEGVRRRAYFAHQNGLEAFPIFAAGVLIAHLGVGAHATADQLALLFVGARLAYMLCYVMDWASVRSVVWLVGLGSSFALLSLPAWA